ncbi:hypothetical protein WMY93_020205 [Mugilogobius chulae]|uniref:Uncharacterized protein n=1 Tax=Mugilogobius chulae TaxID=88201 RepID=A0AAW0NRC7_9GOBI
MESWSTKIVSRLSEENAKPVQMGDPRLDKPGRVSSGPSTGAVIGGILGSLVVIGIVVGVALYIRKYHMDDGPPKHKPPPPVKIGSSTEMLNKPSEPPSATETFPLGPGEVYYETSATDSVLNMDDDGSGGGALNGGAKYDTMNDGLHGNDHDAAPVNIARGESFVSPAMYV